MDCRACSGDLGPPVFTMAPMPLAGAFADGAEEARTATRYPFAWHECERCQLVNVIPDIPDATLYRHYRYGSSTVAGLVRHFDDYAAWLAGRLPRKVRALDIGCNDGVLLKRLPRTWQLVGVDPSDVALGGASEDYDLLNEPFTAELAGEIGPFDLITSSNAFAHFTGLQGAIRGIAIALAPDGLAVIEVHDLDATLASGQWDTAYHEHKVEWSATSLQRAFGRAGLRLVELEHLPLHGGLLRAVFRHGKPDRRHGPAADYRGLQEAYDRRTPPPTVGRVAAYGASARATVWLNQQALRVEYVIDGSPNRAGLFVPGLGTPIVTPAHLDADTTIITAWNYAADIRAQHPDYRGRWVTAWT